MRGLFIITARAGSKRLPNKNIKILGAKPLILHTLDCALSITNSENIYVSTDSKQIIEIVETHGVKVPFKRPKNLALDNSSSEKTLIHAINHYEKYNSNLDYIVLLQPTSPFRTASNVVEAVSLYKKTPNIDMVVSVVKSNSNSNSKLYEADRRGFLRVSTHDNKRLSDLYNYNGAIYVMNVKSLRKYKYHSKFKKVIKYEMNKESSIDIDTKKDWILAENLYKNENWDNYNF